MTNYRELLAAEEVAQAKTDGLVIEAAYRHENHWHEVGEEFPISDNYWSEWLGPLKNKARAVLP